MFCIWGFWVILIKMNLITFLSFSIYVVWKIKTLEKNALPLKKRKREKDRKGEKNHERIKYTKFCFFFFFFFTDPDFNPYYLYYSQ